MSYNRILTVQDISCVGQCSLTVALPILSACGLETAILPSAVLSTHSVGFNGYTFRDLTDDIPVIQAHWIKEEIKFDAVYTGYLGNARQIEMIQGLFATTLREGARIFVDPAMADRGKLYPGFDEAHVAAMGCLCAVADYILPNITEACLLTGMDYRTEYNESYIHTLMNALQAKGCRNIILTGVSYRAGFTGVLIREGDTETYYEHEALPVTCHGTGDIYASVCVGAMMLGKSASEAARIAADYTVACIRATAEEKNHWYGVKFEPLLGKLIAALS